MFLTLYPRVIHPGYIGIDIWFLTNARVPFVVAGAPGYLTGHGGEEIEDAVSDHNVVIESDHSGNGNRAVPHTCRDLKKVIKFDNSIIIFASYSKCFNLFLLRNMFHVYVGGAQYGLFRLSNTKQYN